ncbi:hypothetical protein E2C01_090842 [Portunus trituberculatus]|uniref:Uncharacterized protein n=1 Tax=Portunus trituberculatus TaxID=210409 RepID=A0A5B7JMG9_PORTR|nr:hypothetical protein [Portunus trituberculatus]
METKIYACKHAAKAIAGADRRNLQNTWKGFRAPPPLKIKPSPQNQSGVTHQIPPEDAVTMIVNVDNIRRDKIDEERRMKSWTLRARRKTRDTTVTISPP